MPIKLGLHNGVSLYIFNVCFDQGWDSEHKCRLSIPSRWSRVLWGFLFCEAEVVRLLLFVEFLLDEERGWVVRVSNLCLCWVTRFENFPQIMFNNGLLLEMLVLHTAPRGRVDDGNPL